MQDGKALPAAPRGRQRDALARIRGVLTRRIWLPRFVYEALPYLYIAIGIAALTSALRIPGPRWILPYLALLALACLHFGLAIVVFLFTPHILFIDSMFGISWPGIPNGLVMFAGAVTIAALVAQLIRRLTTPLLQVISSADDYISWVMTLLPVLTGMMAYARIGGPYQTLLAVHILTVEAMLIWFPFGKLFHAFLWVPSRAQLGAAMQRRGVKA